MCSHYLCSTGANWGMPGSDLLTFFGVVFSTKQVPCCSDRLAMHPRTITRRVVGFIEESIINFYLRLIKTRVEALQ